MHSYIKLSALSIAAVFAFAAPASALFYGDLSDPAGTVSFLNVQDINGLYGGPLDGEGNPSGPTVSLNSIDFTPINFQEDCSFCATPETTTDTVSFEIDALTGYGLNEVNIAEEHFVTATTRSCMAQIASMQEPSDSHGTSKPRPRRCAPPRPRP